jgi:hypothetical protein
MRWIAGTNPSPTKAPENLAADLAARLKAGEAVIAGATSDNKDLHVYGSHMYVVRKVVERKGAEPLIKLWNPWGVEHPKAMTVAQFHNQFDEVVTNKNLYSV